MSADSGWPCPDIRWQEPHAASLAPGSPFTTFGAGPCSSGNQSGGLLLPATAAASYSRLLPGTRSVPFGVSFGYCTASGMLNAQDGRPFGIVSGAGACA